MCLELKSNVEPFVGAIHSIRVMHFKNQERLKSLVKGISWRVVGTLDTFLIAYIITGNASVSLSIGGVEIFTKIILYYFHERAWNKVSVNVWEKAKNIFSFIDTKTHIFSVENSLISRNHREVKNKHKGCVIWLTGLSGSGKTTIAHHLEKRLFDENYSTKILDGDILRSGINADLGFSEEDRNENIRRTAEIAKLFAEAGVITIVSLITPKERFRELARQIVGDKDFHLVYVDTSLEECERRDVKGLYAKARRGEIRDFTGIDSPFEPVKNNVLRVNTEILDIEASIDIIQKNILDNI